MLVLVIVIVTLGLMLTRPRGIAEGYSALLGAVAMVGAGRVSAAAIPGLVHETGSVLLFLAGMMLLTGIVERAGVFDFLADRCAQLARGNGILLFVNLYLLAAVVTTTLSLDVTIIMLTPIIHALTIRRRIDPIPFVFACVFVANTVSLALPVSNLTNLLVFEYLDLSFGSFLRTMWWPNLVALIATLLIFLWLFRDRIPRRVTEMPEPASRETVKAEAWLTVNGTVLSLTLIGLFVLGLTDHPLWWASVAGAATLVAFEIATSQLNLRQAVTDLSPSLFLFVISMTIIVTGFKHAWIDGRTIPIPGSLPGSLLLAIGSGVLGSNVVNNVPMTLVSLSVIEGAPVAVRHALAYGTLVGVNIGPALTTYGSLATILWLTLIRRRGIHISTTEYMRVSLVTVPPLLLLTGLTLYVVLRMAG